MSHIHFGSGSIPKFAQQGMRCLLAIIEQIAGDLFAKFERIPHRFALFSDTENPDTDFSVCAYYRIVLWDVNGDVARGAVFLPVNSNASIKFWYNTAR